MIRNEDVSEIHVAKYRLCWQLLWEVHIHVRREEKGTGLTPTIANLSAGHVLVTYNGTVFGALLEEGLAEKKPMWLEWMHGYLRSRRTEDSEVVHRATGEGRLFSVSGEGTGENCLKLETQLLDSVLSIRVFSVWRSGRAFLPTVNVEVKRASAESGKSLCVH